MAVAEKSTQTAGATTQAPTELVEITMKAQEKHSVTTALPLQVLDQLKAEATRRDITDNSVVREIVAAHYGFKIVDNRVPRVGKYAGLSKEEAKAKKSADNQKKRAKMERILAAIDEGLFTPEQMKALGLEEAAA